MNRKNVREIIIDIIERKGKVGSGEVARAAGVTRQAAHYHLRRMVAEGLLEARGRGRGSHYLFSRVASRGSGGSSSTNMGFLYSRAGLEEDRVWSQLEGKFGNRDTNDDRILHYAFTELLNNAIEHSQGSRIRVLIEKGMPLAFEIDDDGVGIFELIRSSLHLPSHLVALQELSKGKLTTSPEKHSGEGIFFVSKAGARFEVESNGLKWLVDNTILDQGIFSSPGRKGTRARFELVPGHNRPLEDIFAEYTSEFRFTRTRTVVKLFAHGVNLVSRSEARRLLNGLEKFSEIILDFNRVAGVGQGFVDEIFRVWARQHPEVELIPTNMNAPIEFMVQRVIAVDSAPTRDRPL